MSKELGLISFFEVTHCGLYIGDKHKDWDLQTVSSKFKKWVEDRDFDETIPWDVKEYPHRTKVFLKDSHHDRSTNDYLFVFWQGHHDNSGRLSGVVANSKVGSNKGDSVSVKHKKVNGQEVVYGNPLYYWFIPELNIVATIKFAHSIASTDRVLEYLRRCFTLRIKDERKEEKESITYHEKYNRDIVVKHVTYRDDEGKAMRFKFSAHLKELSIKNSDLAELSNKITHLVVREMISSPKKDDRDSLFKLFNRVNKKQTNRLSKQVEIISEASVSPEDLEELIQVYDEEKSNYFDDWGNIGFRTVDADSSTKWFNSYIDRVHLSIETSNFHDSTYYPAKVIMDEIRASRKTLLHSIRNYIDKQKVAV